MFLFPSWRWTLIALPPGILRCRPFRLSVPSVVSVSLRYGDLVSRPLYFGFDLWKDIPSQHQRIHLSWYNQQAHGQLFVAEFDSSCSPIPPYLPSAKLPCRLNLVIIPKAPGTQMVSPYYRTGSTTRRLLQRLLMSNRSTHFCVTPGQGGSGPLS